MRFTASLTILVVILFSLISSTGCTGTTSGSPSVSVPATSSVTDLGATTALPGNAAPVFTLHAAGIENGALLPAAYTCSAEMPSSPPVSWENVPDGTKTLTLVVDDPDASPGTFTHWIVYNIPPERNSIPAGVGAAKEIDGGGQQGTSSADQRGYYPACPPIGLRHRYIFTLYAVDYTMGLPIADRDVINVMLNDHVIGESSVTTYYSR